MFFAVPVPTSHASSVAVGQAYHGDAADWSRHSWVQLMRDHIVRQTQIRVTRNTTISFTGVPASALWMALRTGEAASYATFRPPNDATKTRVHPHDAAWCVSRLLLSWVEPLLALGNAKQLDENDLWPLRPSLEAEASFMPFEHKFAKSNSIPRSFLGVFGWRFFFTGVAFLISMLCNLVGPMALNRVVTALSGSDSDSSFSLQLVIGWVIFLVAAQVTLAFSDNYANFNTEVIAIQFTSALKSLMFRKTLRLSAESRLEKSTGDISNLYTADSDALLRAAFFIHQIWLIPLQIVIVSYMLYRVLGVASLAGIAVIVVMLFINNLVSKRMYGMQRVYRSSKDTRMNIVTEVFKAIGIVKFNSWEEKFTERINEAREVELRDLFHMRLMTCASTVLMWGMPVFISIAAFGTFAFVLGHQLTPAIVFTSLALFQLIQWPLRLLTMLITMLVQSIIALERVAAFLDMTELDPMNVITADHPEASQFVEQSTIVAIQNGEFGWDNETTLLKNVNLDVKIGDFLVVHGTVGCGKSSLCSALLGEMVKRQGTVFVGGSVAYCSQQPWIQNLTVRDNILFGLPFDRKKYDKVLDACALTTDLKSLPAGDKTEIGERGVNVSGGQKARIALARACYSDASVFILDSPLSAVDAIVQNEIFQKCMLGLLRNKTIILVTHNPEIISSEYITRAITIDEIGTVVETHQVLSRPDHLPLVSPLPAHGYTAIPSFVDSDGTTEGQSTSDDAPTFEEMKELNDEIALDSPFNTPRVKTFGETGDGKDAAVVEEHDESGKLIEDEERSEGRVGSHVFAAYYRAVGGFPVVFGIFMSQVFWQGFQITSDFWLSWWSSDVVPEDEMNSNTAYRLGIYSILGLLATTMVLARTLTVTYFGMRASQNLFDRMTESLLHAPMRFFDTNPIGRILTRYGGDVSAVDVEIPFTFGSVTTYIFSIGCTAVTAAIIIQWKGLLLIPIVYLYAKIGQYYIQPAREVQRLVQTTRAPILNHLSETVDGGSIVRAFGPQQVGRVCTINNAKLDDNHKVWFAQLCVSQWFALRIQLTGSLVLIVITTSLVMLRDILGATIIALAFSYALIVAGNLEDIVKSIAYLETMMVSPERIQQYIDIEQEPPHRLIMSDPSSNTEWPSEGAIKFDKVSFRYKPNDRLVLEDVDFAIRGREKIGIVGRTGAGKSSLTMALFRINEVASGSISIDGVNIASLGLKALRSKLSIIPQHPVLFKGTLRNYLDPFDEFTDEELWGSIRKVGLVSRVESDELKLALQVEENGENFSVGERQMLCMARALLRHSRIVVFDEATAAIDHETDQKLQGVIRSAFKESTVLTIAHRLDTILDSDRVLVLDGGAVVEFAPPKDLVSRGSGHFFELVREGGFIEMYQDTTV